MSADRPSSFDHHLTAWLERDAHPRPPDDLLTQVLDRVAETRRRPSWLVTERWIPMETTARFGAIPRAAMLLLIVGVMLAFAGTFAAGGSQPPPLALIASDHGTGAFGPGPSLSETRVSHTATLLPDGRVLVAGGYDEGGSSTELFDPETGTFTLSGGLVRPRHYHTETLLPDGRILLVGGLDQGGAEVWYPQTGSSRLVGPLTEDRANHSATLLRDGRVLIAGGYDASAMTELFDPSTSTFEPGPSLANARGHHRAVRLGDGRVLIVGGPAAAEIWDPATGTFQSAGELREARWWPTATLLEGDRVLVTGGGSGAVFGEGYGPLASAELWDPATMTFSPAGEMSEGRLHHTATLLPDGRVLVIGSGGPDAPLATAESWDQATATFGPAASLAQARGGHTATLLGDGRVLVTGGYGQGEVSLASTEIWDPLALTDASAGRDWPGPLRAEPPDGAPIVPASRKIDGTSVSDRYWDQPGGEGLAGSPWLDIVEIGMTDSGSTYVHLAAIPEPADPADHRRAYGVVVDADLDGVADYRMGMENAPGGEYRLWVTDLRTGATTAGTGAPYVPMGAKLPDATYPGDSWFERGLGILSRPVRGVAKPYHFYAWASEIAGGRIVATDYAPDSGWLEPRPFGP